MSEEYTIGDLAKQLNITTRTIRYYDQKGLVKPSRVSESGYRLYSNEQIKQLKLIIFLMKNARKSPYFNVGMDRACRL
ncbi:MerR family transcriptional regulator [Lactobacillus amylovorus]|uniref:MerR family transcriptional regulator n=1 Tax=Lactobacillus amylovorus TaxID=1604 RepID=UPI0022DF8FA3|nr:MerR family transcriptional regulator [Lactobacillus amylovorus]